MSVIDIRFALLVSRPLGLIPFPLPRPLSILGSREACADIDPEAASDIDQILPTADDDVMSSIDEGVVPREDIEYINLPPWAIRAGARRTIYHDPKTTVAAVVTCGRLCPGVNDVVQVCIFNQSD